MAYTENMQTRTYIAGADLSAKQFFFVKLGTTAKEVVVCGDGEEAAGVLLNSPASGEAATVAYAGRVMVEAGAAVTANGNVASDAAGNAVDAVTSDIILGKAMEDGADGQIITIDFFLGGNASA